MVALTTPTVMLSLFHVDPADGLTLGWGLSSEADTETALDYANASEL